MNSWRGLILISGIFWLAGNADATPDEDWLARSTGPGVVYANRFDNEKRDFYANLWPDPRVDRRSAYYDQNVVASGKGSVRFDVIPGGEGFGGALAVSLGDDLANQFGAGDEFWVQWRQRFDPYVLNHRYAVTQGSGQWKQLIIAQGQLPGQRRYDIRSCTENEIVVSNLSGKRYPQSYHGCWVYQNIDSGTEAGAISRMNFGNERGARKPRRIEETWSCQYWPPESNEGGCKFYRANEWMTFMVHVSLGPAGEAASSIGSSRTVAKGFVNSTYELYMGYDGDPQQLVHRKTGIVFRRGNYEDDPKNSSHAARYGVFHWTPFLSFKDSSEQHETASTWVDEIIISRERIEFPGSSDSEPIPKPSVSDN